MNNSRNFAYGKPGLFLAKETLIAIAVVSILTSNPCLAQITPDTTLGNQNSRVTTGVNIQGNQADLIEGGVQSGSNLYHSFLEFNVNNRQRVYFANPTGVDNIFSRVTGINPTHILGTLGVNGVANLFLLNPKGIIFGPNAQLDIQGSFLATTANSFQFPDGSEFSATNPQAPPLLTMSVPVGVQFGSQPAASITSQGHLVVGKDLTLNAGNFNLAGTLQAGGNLTLQAQGSVYLSGSTLNSNNTGSGYVGAIKINASDQVSILNNSKISSTGNFGSIDITTGSLFLNDNSQINTNNNPGNNNNNQFVGSIKINASDQVSILNNSKISSTGNFGYIDITTGRLSLEQNSQINTDNTVSGFGGYIKINTRDQVSILNNSTISSKGDFGFIVIDTGSLFLKHNSEINTDNTVSGFGGYIEIKASDQVSILNNSKISSTGNFGYIDITTGRFSLEKKSQISTDNNSDNNTNNNQFAGQIEIKASDQVSIFNNSKISSTGKFGFIVIDTGSLFLNDNSQINTNNNSGNDTNDDQFAGNIGINARGQVSILKNSTISSQGNFGIVEINTGSLFLNDNSQINTNNNSDNNNNNGQFAGDIEINARGQVSIFKNSTISSQGNFGIIVINTDSLFLNQNSAITTNNSSGDAGYIAITTQNLLLRRGSKISTTGGAGGNQGNGGNITINAEDGFVVAVPSENSDIIANAFGGQGGRIEINANRILGFQNQGKLSSQQLRNLTKNDTSDISASSDVGDNGEVSLNTLSIDPTQGLVQLPTNLVDTSRLIAQGCGSNSNVAKGKSEFVITGRGGLPPSPDDTLKPGAISPEWVVNNTANNGNNSVNMTERNFKQLSSNNGDILVEAVGMVRSANGDIVFTAQPTTATGVQSGLSSQVCGVVQGNVKP